MVWANSKTRKIVDCYFQYWHTVFNLVAAWKVWLGMESIRIQWFVCWWLYVIMLWGSHGKAISWGLWNRSNNMILFVGWWLQGAYCPICYIRDHNDPFRQGKHVMYRYWQTPREIHLRQREMLIYCRALKGNSTDGFIHIPWPRWMFTSSIRPEYIQQLMILQYSWVRLQYILREQHLHVVFPSGYRDVRRKTTRKSD